MLELAGQVVGGIETEDQGDFFHGHGGIEEEILGLLDTGLELILFGAQASSTLERLAEPGIADAQGGGNILHPHPFLVLFHDQPLGALDKVIPMHRSASAKPGCFQDER
jgi:hypothetical protein